jgi:hypothetical protein
MNPVYPLVALWQTRGPVKLGGGLPPLSRHFEAGVGGLPKIGSGADGEAHFLRGATHWRDPTRLLE